jgi:hypothetical protein
MAFYVDPNYENVFIGSSFTEGSSTFAKNLTGGYGAGISSAVGIATPDGVSGGFVGNIALGPIALANVYDSRSNIAIGNATGQYSSNMEGNILTGVGSGYKCSNAYSNIAIGHSTLQYQTNVSDNIFVGYGVGYATNITPASGNTENVVIGDGSFQYSSSNSSNIAIGQDSLINTQNSTSNLIIGHGSGSLSGVNSVFSIGNSNVVSFRGSSNIFIGSGIGNSMTASGTIAIGHGVDVSGLSGAFVIGTADSTFFYADVSTKTIQIGGRESQFTYSNNTLSLLPTTTYTVRVSAPLYTPYSKHLSVANDDVLPTFPYIFIDQSSSATRVTLDTSLSNSVTTGEYNTPITIVNNKPSAVTLCGSFFEVNKPLVSVSTYMLSGNTSVTFTKLLFVNPAIPTVSQRYYIGYLQ